MALDIRKAIREVPPPLDFVLPGMLAGTVGALVSPGGAGKSILSLQLAVLIVLGMDICGMARDAKYICGKAAILAGEDPIQAIEHRVHALGKFIPEDQVDKFADGLLIEGMVGQEPDVMQEEWFEKVRAFAVGRRVLFLDTLRRFHRLDENDAASMSVLIGRLEKISALTGCAIIFLHHSSKAAALQGQGDQAQASRGSSVLVDNIRWQFFLAGMTKAQADDLKVQDLMRGRWVRAGVSKQNYGTPFAELWLLRQTGGVLVEAHPDSPGVGGERPRGRGVKRGEA